MYGRMRGQERRRGAVHNGYVFSVFSISMPIPFDVKSMCMKGNLKATQSQRISLKCDGG